MPRSESRARTRRRLFARSAVLLSVLVLVTATPVAAEKSARTSAPTAEITPLLWRVEGSAGTIYLYGSIHVAPPEVLPPPAVVREAFARSRTLVTEVPLDAGLHSALAGGVAARSELPEGIVFADLFSADEWETVVEWSRSVGIETDAIDTMQPWIVELLAVDTGDVPGNFSPEHGLDMYFGEKARSSGMRRVGLETVEEQLDVLSGGTLEEQAASFMETLAELETRTTTVELYEAWRRGDLEQLGEIVTSQYRDPSRRHRYERLFTERNKKWVVTLEEMLTAGGSSFVVVGAGHLAGPDNVLELLRDNGYKPVRILEPTDFQL